MPVFPIIILLSLNMGNSGGAPQIILNPNFVNFLIGDSVTLTCVGDPDDGPPYQWYKTQQQIPGHQRSLEIQNSREQDSGAYQCQSGSQDKSDTVTLTVTYKVVILQTPPPPIYEGDPVTLRCHHRKDYDGRNARFYKDDIEIPSHGSELRIPAADTDTTGKYTCMKEIRTHTAIDYRNYTPEAEFISVKGAAEKPVVTFNPNWNVIFTTESIMMTCNVRTSPAGNTVYTWTRDNREIHTGRTYEISGTESRHRGSYRCKGSNTAVSDPAVLSISNGWVILQAPLFVHEGDDLPLRCHHYPGYTAGSSTFYKEGRIIRILAPDPNFHMKNISLEASGKYTCVKDLGGNYRGDTTITVRELFPKPIIRVTPERIREGEEMAVTCDTRLAPLRPDTQLLYAFYRDGYTVQEFSLDDTYRVQFAQTYDSGGYSCEVRTVSHSPIRKRSDVSYIQILPGNNHDPTHQTSGSSTATPIDGNNHDPTHQTSGSTTATPIDDYSRMSLIRFVLSGIVLIIAVAFIYFHNQ